MRKMMTSGSYPVVLHFAVGSPPVSTCTCACASGAFGIRRRHPSPRTLIPSQIDWPERVDSRPRPAPIDTAIQVGKSSLLMCPLLVSRTQAQRELQTPLRLIHPYRRSESVTCVDGWMHSHVVLVGLSEF